MTTTACPALRERFRHDSDEVLTELYRRYSRPLFALAMRLLGDRELAADAVQLSFVRAWRAAATFDPNRDLQPWLYGIARRSSIDVWRRESRRTAELSLEESGRDAEQPVDGPSLERAWRVFQVRRALEALPSDEREVLWLAYFEDLTQRDIAARLAIPLGTVNSRTTRAKRRLAATLAHVGG